MGFIMEAACFSDKGIARMNHEDNFYFAGRCLPQNNAGLADPIVLNRDLSEGAAVAVFDGMGGENYGEIAAWCAANAMCTTLSAVETLPAPEEQSISTLIAQMNEAVVRHQKELFTDRMGTTVAALFFDASHVLSANLGDSRIYRLREREFRQLSEDHLSSSDSRSMKKSPLLQYLGLDPEEICLDPCLYSDALSAGDVYLLCSDGLTDMLSNLEISSILEENSYDPALCVRLLIDASLENGGQDNITVIVCRIDR